MLQSDARSLVVFITTICIVFADQKPVRWDYDVYTGRHFNTLVTATTKGDDVVVKPSMLILYQPACEEAARGLRSTLRPWGPMDKYLNIAWHDYKTFPNHIWYNLDDIDNLKRRYISPMDSCLKVGFNNFFSSKSNTLGLFIHYIVIYALNVCTLFIMPNVED